MDSSVIKGVQPGKLKEMIETRDDILVIDLRPEEEVAKANLGGIHIPLGEIDKRAKDIPRDKLVFMYCKDGQRSYMAIMFLQQEHQFENLVHLQGGITHYAQVLDPSMDVF
ncbi:MAG: rhodanese-like domain-containing protein [Aureispira sp.]|nr:rhodanese-like domain-containing protein [Aureispira sp.]